MHTGGLVSMFGQVRCVYIRSISMVPREHLERSPCRRALVPPQSFSTGLVPEPEAFTMRSYGIGASEVSP